MWRYETRIIAITSREKVNLSLLIRANLKYVFVVSNFERKKESVENLDIEFNDITSDKGEIELKKTRHINKVKAINANFSFYICYIFFYILENHIPINQLVQMSALQKNVEEMNIVIN